MKIKNLVKTKNGKLKNKSFLITGKLEGISRAEIKSIIEQNAGKILSSVNSKLDYLITGENPTKNKLIKAKELKIKVLDQNEFNQLLK